MTTNTQPAKPSVPYAKGLISGLFVASASLCLGQVIPIDPVTGVTASSEIAAPFDRIDDHLVNGNGLVGDFHTATVEGNMWLSRGIGFGGEDFDPEVVFDLGGLHRVSKIRIWNYNEGTPNLTNRGVNAMTVDYGETLAFGNTVAGISALAQADGTAGYAGEVFEAFEPFVARYIRFDIESNYGDGSQFYGLSEVQFEGVFVGVELDETVFLSSGTQGRAVGTLTTLPPDPGETYTYQLETGDGDSDNDKFQLNGDQLELGNFDFSASVEGQEFSIRVKSTSSPSGEVVSTVLTPVALVDGDGDQLADSWEEQWAPGNPTLLNGLGDADADLDGLTDLEEYQLRVAFPLLNPTQADSDLDNLDDGEEVAGAGDRPATNPTLADTDGDGLSDEVESNTGILVNESDSGSNPTLRDTDDDGADDAKEVARGSNPNDPASLPQNVLVGYWDFESEVSPQPDRSGFGNVATVFTGANWTNDAERGGVMDFDGFDSYLEAADSESLSIEGDISIAAWVRVRDFAGFRGIVGKTAGLTGNQPAPYDLYFLQNSGRMRFFTGSPGMAGQVTGVAIPVLDQWHHIAVTRVDNDVTLYFDGEVDAEGVVTTTMLDADGPLRIGNRADFVTDFSGRLDDVAIFAGALSATEVQEVMAGDFSGFGLGGGSLELRVTQGEGGLRFEWETSSGQLYDLVSSTDLSTSPDNWPVFQNDGIVYGNIEGTGSTAVRENVPLIGERRFFALIEKNP